MRVVAAFFKPSGCAINVLEDGTWMQWDAAVRGWVVRFPGCVSGIEEPDDVDRVLDIVVNRNPPKLDGRAKNVLHRVREDEEFRSLVARKDWDGVRRWLMKQRNCGMGTTSNLVWSLKQEAN